MAILGALLMLSACGGGGGNTSAGAVAKACEQGTNMGAEICDCVGKMAADELSPEGRAFLVAALEEDQAAAEAARRKMGAEETIKAGTFMVRAPAACARNGAGG